MIIFAHLMSIKVVAVGIESQQQSEYVKSAAIDYLQGYFVAKPRDVDAMEQQWI